MSKRLLFAITLFIHCGLKQPVEHIILTQEGELVVESTPPGARIFLDRQNTNLFTPDTLTRVPVGSHLIQVYLEGFQSQPDSARLEVSSAQRLTVSFHLQKIETSGRLILFSTPANAEIFINGNSSGFRTPDTLSLPAGRHDIALRKNGYLVFQQRVDLKAGMEEKIIATLTVQKRVLLEAFGNVSCAPCVDGAHNLHQFSQNHSPEQYELIEYFANWPSPNDPFYKEAPQDVTQRVNYYQLNALPSLFIAGSTGVDATRYNDIVDTFQSISANQSGLLGLSVEKSINAGVLQVSVELDAAEGFLLSPSLRLFVAVIENGIHYDTAPGSNGLQDFDNVFRGFLSDRNGDALSTERQQFFNYSKTWPHWNYSQTNIIAFIQDINSKTILHCTSE